MPRRSTDHIFPFDSIKLMKSISLFSVALFCLLAPQGFAAELLFEDQFERSETNDALEQVGNGWQTNSRTRAKGNKQVDLSDGAMHIYRHAEADHGVSVVQDMKFKDATISMRFKIGKGDELGINIADMKEKSVHAGHLCMAKIRVNQVMIMDMKTGQMNLEMRTRSKAKQLTAEDKKLLATKKKVHKLSISPDEWHKLTVSIAGNTMTVSIDGAEATSFTSPGIGHETKSRLRLAVAKDAWVDDITVHRDDR